MPIAMAAATTVGMIFTIFQFAGISVASIAEVFVGKHNGADEKHEMGPIVWQMIWFSVISAIVFIPVGLWGGKLFLPEKYYQYGLSYFKILMFFGPLFPCVAALSSFYIGQGKVKLVTVSTIAANMINIVLAYVFIFGAGTIIPGMGAAGAALASSSAIFIQAIILFWVFLQKKYRLHYNTGQYRFIFKKFWSCLKVGVPNAAGYLIEMTAWACLLQMMVRKDSEHIMVLAIGQAIFLLLAFTTDGLQKSIVTIASNIIGSKKLELLPTLIKSAVKLHGIMALCFSIPLIFFPAILVHLFFSSDVLSNNASAIMAYGSTTCLWILFYFIFDGLVWISAGILTAFEDTVFVMIMNAVSVWLFAILPNYIAIKYFNTDPSIIWKLMTVYAIINALGFSLRYFKKVPLKSSVISNSIGLFI
jgi:MATE family multidrug resistance protein